MLIAKYIGDLLFDYECVVVPGLGGFIVNDKHAEINYTTHYFNPPFREVMFNPYLLTNDGLLLNYIAKEENITYQQAKHKIDGFVLACHNALNKGKKIKFNKIGSIYKDDNDKVIFEQDTNVNYNPDSFGLTSFISPAIRRVSDEERIKEVFTGKATEQSSSRTQQTHKTKRKDKKSVVVETSKRNKKKKIIIPPKKSPYKNQVIFIALLIFAMITGWVIMNRHAVNYYYEVYGDRIPVFYSEPGTYLANNVEILPVYNIADKFNNLWIIKKLAGKEDNVINNNANTINNSFVFEDNEVKTEPEKLHKDLDDSDLKSSTEETEITNENQIISAPVLNKENSNTTSELSEDITENNPASTNESETNEIKTDNGFEENINTEPISEEIKVHSRFFVIAGSFKDRDNANKLIFKLKKLGYNAVIAGENPYGMIRVAYGTFSNRGEALNLLNEIRQLENPSAWLMKK
jgi:cell division septation protein DedD